MGQDDGLVMLFPGQGSQALGMGTAFLDADPDAAALLERAEVLTDLPLGPLIRRGPMRELTVTNVLQPALCAVAAVMLQAVRKLGLDAVAVAGHSLGELIAAHAAGAFDFDTLIRLAAIRGRLMQEAADRHGGGMVALVGPENNLSVAVRRIVEEAQGTEMLCAANFNSPRQIVLSGSERALEAAVEQAHAHGLKARALAVSGPWHSPAMTEAEQAFVEVVATEEIGDCRIELWSALDAEPVTSGTDVTRRLTRLLNNPVRWTETMRNMRDRYPASRWVEVGPGKVLTGFLLQLDRSVEVFRADTPRAIDRLVRDAEGDAA